MSACGHTYHIILADIIRLLLFMIGKWDFAARNSLIHTFSAMDSEHSWIILNNISGKSKKNVQGPCVFISATLVLTHCWSDVKSPRYQLALCLALWSPFLLNKFKPLLESALSLFSQPWQLPQLSSLSFYSKQTTFVTVNFLRTWGAHLSASEEALKNKLWCEIRALRKVLIPTMKQFIEVN